MKAKKLFGFILIGLFLTGSVLGIDYGMSAAAKSAATASAISGTQMVPANFSELAEKVRSGVVNIQVTRKVSNAAFRNFPGNPFGDMSPFGEFFSPFEGNPPAQKQQGVGSGNPNAWPHRRPCAGSR